MLQADPGYQVKQVEVDPGKRLSLQFHNYRAEHWVVVEGQALVTIGREEILANSNESVYVPRKTPPRLENPGTTPLRIIEVQTGSYIGKDDIESLVGGFWRLKIDSLNL